MDLEKLSSSIDVDSSKVKDISVACTRLLDVQKQIADIENQLKTIQEQELKLSEQIIPNLMQEMGISLLKLADGSSVEVKPYYAAKIPTDKTTEAFQWLRDNGHGDLIKNNITVTFGRSEDDRAKELIDLVQQKGHSYKQAEKVEPMTLKAFVREQIQNGRMVPSDIFGIYVANKTKITNKE
jgi:Asp-tRNA(Asn)/Glu-tRNA(Gln) amidotransferase B subunit